MVLRALVIVAFMHFFASPALAGGSIYFCNKTQNDIQLAIAERVDSTFETRGWLNILSGYCEKVRNISETGDFLHWTARSIITPDDSGASSWAFWEDVSQEAPVFCVEKNNTSSFHFFNADKSHKCAYRMRFSTLKRMSDRDLVIRLTERGPLVPTSDDSPILVRDRYGDLVPKTVLFQLSCRTNWNSTCEEIRNFELPAEAEYCSHFMHIKAMNYGSATVIFTAPGFTHAISSAVGSGNYFDRWRGNANQHIYVGVVPFGQYSEDRCLPHSSWLGFCDIPGPPGSGPCAKRCNYLSELDQVKDPECMRLIQEVTPRWLARFPVDDSLLPSQGQPKPIPSGFPAKAKEGDLVAELKEDFYFSIVGSFRTKVSAVRFHNYLKDHNKDLDLDVFLPYRNSRYWIVTNSDYAKKTDAVSAADQARKVLPKPDAFVLRLPHVTR